MTYLQRVARTLVGGVLVAGSAATAAGAAAVPTPADSTVRIAVFNIRELSTAKLTATDADGAGTDPQVLAAARIIQLVRPDILVVQEIDSLYDGDEVRPEANPQRLIDNYLNRGPEAIDYPYVFAGLSNTGVPSGIDLNNDGRIAGPGDLDTRVWGGDSLGWGEYPGQYSMALLSRYPIDRRAIRTFRKLLWRDLPGNHLPTDFYTTAAQAILPLSSKSHWDVPIEIGDATLHIWVSHPTPGGFDGPEDRNGRRNFDELSFWTLYPTGWRGLADDQGRAGGYGSDDPFVILGDLNADRRAESRYEGRAAIAHLLAGVPGLQDSGPWCTSPGGLDGRAPGPPDFWEQSTAVFRDGMKIDHLLPSGDLEIVRGGVYWPDEGDDPEGHELAETASDHRLVWVGIRLKTGR